MCKLICEVCYCVEYMKYEDKDYYRLLSKKNNYIK